MSNKNTTYIAHPRTTERGVDVFSSEIFKGQDLALPKFLNDKLYKLNDDMATYIMIENKLLTYDYE